MRGYLLDTNHACALANKPDANLLARLASLPVDAQVRVCTITLGEIEAGHRTTQPTDQNIRDSVTAYVNATFLPNALPVSVSTRIYYASIIERLWKTYPKPRNRGTEEHLRQLGTDVNDVWIVAVAWEHGLTLVTTDKMEKIRGVVSDCEVRFESWL